MDNERFDQMIRHLARGASRRETLIGLAGGLLVPLASWGEAAARGSAALHAAQKKRKRSTKKRCKGGKTRCGKRCVDTRSDAANCGGCRRACTAPATCGGGAPGTPGICGCTKTTCAAQGKNCGTIPDGCGSALHCGDACPTHESCGGGGTPNVCGCLADGTVTTFDNRDACCSGDCCSVAPGQCACAGGCG